MKASDFQAKQSVWVHKDTIVIKDAGQNHIFEDEEDVRVSLLADTVRNKIRYWRGNAARKGLEDKMASIQMLQPLSWICQVLLLMYLFLTPPNWCTKLGNTIDRQCEYLL
jgi:hypothetical protein